MRVAVVVAMAVLAITMSGCGDGDDDVVAEPAAMTATRSEVEQAYMDYWELVGRLETVEPTQDPQLARLATGPALTEITSELAMLDVSEQLNEHGEHYEHRVLVVTVGGAGSDEATLSDCFVDDSTLIERDSGEPVADAEQGTTTQLLEATLVLRDTWQVRSIETVDTFDGVDTAACGAGEAGGAGEGG
jgi:hypothetical protein